MVKNIIKELVIIILLIVAVCLILTVILYEYIPANKIVPNKVEAYVVPEVIQSELAIDLESSTILQTYEKKYDVDDSALKIYESSNSYNPGKVNPFASVSEKTIRESNVLNGQNEVNSGNTNTVSNQTGNTTSKGTFFDDGTSK